MHPPKPKKGGEATRKGDRQGISGPEGTKPTPQTQAPASETPGSISGFSRGVTFDVDVERFKSKMESALNALKVEALSELLVAKRNMLQEHAEAMAGESERHQCEVSVRDAEVH